MIVPDLHHFTSLHVNSTSTSAGPPSMFTNSLLFSHQLPHARYSSFICANGYELASLDWKKRTCMFTNVGFQDGKIIFHEDPMLPKSDWGFNWEKLPLFTGYATGIDITSIPIPEKEYPDMFSTTPLIFGEVNFLSSLPGHDFEMIWTVWNSMFDMGMMSMDNIVMMKTTDYKGRRAPLSKFWRTLSSTVLDFADFAQQYRKGVLIPTLVLCPRLKGFPTLSSGYLAKLFRDRAYYLLGFNLEHRNALPKIGLRLKTRRHRFTNHNEILRHLSTCCPQCDVVDFRPSETMSLKDEFAALSSFDVYLTPCGGGSFSSVFLRDGATAIFGYICYRNEKNELAHFELEGRVWDLHTHFFHQHLGCPPTVNELVESDTWKNKTNQIGFSYALQLDDALNRAIKQALVRNGFNATHLYTC